MTFTSFSRLALLAVAVLGCASFPARSATPVILISVDTLRADHLASRQSPHIDALAKTGTLFSQISTPFPLTLPAHVALFTATYPFANGVQDNGIPLNSTATTLATVFKKAGYRTSAFVGSFVLDRRFGLSRGFDVYDGPLDVHNNIAAGPVDHKRPGDQVTEGAKRWLEQNAAAPYFLFLHLYDLHAPYSLPPDPSLRHGETGYQAELDFVDKLLGDFFTFLEQRGLFDKALIVFTSDHGEGLGEHGEKSHGYFIYQSTLHVPLIIHWPAGPRRLPQNRIDEPANLIDVAPTILDAVSLVVPPEMRGHSLMNGGQAEDVYSESVYARNHFGCAALRSLRVAGYKYIDAPKPELYDLTNDPNEQRNLYDQQRSKAAALRERMVAIRGNTTPPASQSPTPETAAALRSLGYLSGSNHASRLASHVDPKDRIADFERFSEALGLAAAGKLAESDNILEKLSGRLPDIADIRMNLGLNRLRLKDEAQAASEFKRVTERDPANAGAHFELGLCYFRQRQAENAIKEFNTTLALEPWYTRADEALAEIYIQNKDFPQARAHLNHLLSIDPASYTGHFNLGIFAAMDQDWNEAQRQITAALQADPKSAEAHKTLGFVFQKQGKTVQAAKEFHAAEEAAR